MRTDATDYMGVTAMELTVDKEFAAFWPELADDAEEKLLANLQKDGCTDPIITWANHDDTILDGYHRYRLCIKHNIPFKTKAITLADRAAALQWIFDRQVGRRNATEGQRAYAAALLVNSHVGRPNSATLPNLSTVADAAKKAGVSERLVTYAGKVREEGGAKLQQAVRDGEIPVAQAAVIAELPKAEQAKIVEKGPEAVAAKVKQLKGKKEPKKHDDSFDPSELNGKAVDAFGNAVPKAIAQVFEICEDFDAQRNKLTSIKTWLTQRGKHPGAKVLEGVANEIKTDIDNADRALRFAKPHCACLYCRNTMPKVANCNACKGLGWITEQIFNGAPESLKRAFKLHPPTVSA